jgi:hypothetical protein
MLTSNFFFAMKYIKSKSILFLLATLVLVSCSDEFLEYSPIALATTESYYTDFESLDYTATAAYGMLCSRDVYDIMYSIGFQSASDDTEMGGENVNDWIAFQRVDRLTHSANESDIERMWAYPYKGIRFANEYLRRVDDIKVLELEKVNTTEEAEVITTLIDQRTAEVRFLRAFYHFTLLQVYGGVPIIDYIMSPDEFATPRNTIAEVLHFIQTELELAVPDLMEKTELGSSEVGRASVGAANALLAKAYLYESSYAENYSGDSRFSGCEDKYALALMAAEEVIASGEYELVGINGERFSSWRVSLGEQVGGYRWMFTLDGDNCGEGVWEIQNIQDGKGWTSSRGNYMTVYTTVRFTNDSDGNQQGGFGWSFNLPTQYLLNAFGNNDSRETGLNSVPVDSTLDPRFQTTIGMEGDQVLYPDGSDNGVWVDMNFSNLPTETISRKYECAPNEYWNGMADYQDGPMNMRLIRYADVVLMAAEAALKTNASEKALTYVNRVRTRARMSGDTGYPVDLTAVSFEDIVHERRLEMAAESSRFFDLVRWGLAEKFIGGTTLAAMGEGFNVDFEVGKHEFFPIPYVEVQLSKGALVQYDAWK